MNVRQLLKYGYLCEELPPPFNSHSLGSNYINIVKDIASLERAKLQPKDTVCVDYLAPKVGIHRRHFSIPHPYPQIKLSVSISQNWNNILIHYNMSKTSISIPEIDPHRKRAIVYLDKYEKFRESCLKASATKRYELHLDISKYFFSIYTHSIPWAIHTKKVAKLDSSSALWGNEIDKYIRASQSKQTKGIPVGTDTSRIVAELIGVAIDLEFERILTSQNIPLVGFRFVDDSRYFFNSLAEAEFALQEYQKILISYSLQLNDEKTLIQARPCPFDSTWKNLLNAIVIDEKLSRKQRTALKDYFNLLITTALNFPKDSVIKYGIKRISKITVLDVNIDIFEALLYNLASSEPTILPDVLVILKKYESLISKGKLKDFVKELIIQNINKGHHFEISWILWIAKSFDVVIDVKLAQEILESNDVISIIILLDLNKNGLISGRLKLTELRKELTCNSLNEEKWLLAYEAEYHSLLRLNNIKKDPFFSILKKNEITFYEFIPTIRKTKKSIKKIVKKKSYLKIPLSEY